MTGTVEYHGNFNAPNVMGPATGTTGQPTQCLGGAKRRFQTRSKEAEAGDGARTVGTGLPRWC